ncbi:MAG: glycerate kinase [gamma proteobacterium symbiont of Bathyaustriella thionipta]|nr:glycerate kinase [gamma proteobacterium symbiont of Bathyaustriella thionipta]MCU7950613.1 glycerate kinase [gamma proteobacterium symbiont of Bathyaustriella thionipta]MCU7954028.1 glycerate kinase [gamma proteobacterium symbiont of Bathyaustriella thionipta]MCU7957052.1 glycerate kinase [gamma proteobacterium symbiont of Bathyaustriella thionipta]MCU7967264.1 glycerate kinase [gamma proteobacterium symbiont of Bathyaustriella thionipta]
MNLNPDKFLNQLFQTAVDAAHPQYTLNKYLPEDTTGRCLVIGAGKAAASMAQALEQSWKGELTGTVVTRYEHGAYCKKIEVIEASHPVPDDAGLNFSKKVIELTRNLNEDDQVIVLLSGGGSSLLSLPAEAISLEDKQHITRALLKSGAPISEVNCVRKHLSAIKGGRLAKACYPARVTTFAISDVPGDDPSSIASGPTVIDPTSSKDALDILQKYDIIPPAAVFNWLNNPKSETVKADEPSLEKCDYHLIATPQDSLEAAAKLAKEQGITPLILGDLEGESRDVASVHAGIARQIHKHGQPAKMPCLLLSGGETTVTVKGNGRGGRNAEFLLALADNLKGHPGIYALAADTDGIDGTEDNAGCLMTPDTYQAAKGLGLDSGKYLENNDGYGFFKKLDSLIITGPTRTNVNDFRAILILDN